MVYGETTGGKWLEYNPNTGYINTTTTGSSPFSFGPYTPPKPYTPPDIYDPPLENQITTEQLQAWVNAFFKGMEEKPEPKPEETKPLSLYDRIQELRKK